MFIITACEEVFTPDDVKAKEEYVVEGHIELSDLNIPAYLVLSKSISYFSNFDTSTLKNIYIDDAKVIVNDGEKDVILEHVCLSELDQIMQLKLLSAIGGKILDREMCLYIDIDNQLVRKAGRIYNLRIEHGDRKITSITTMPERVNLDSIYYKDPPGNPIDTMTLLWGKIPDPPNESNYYQYDVKNRSLSRKIGSTLRDDKLFDGKTIDMPFPNPLSYEGSKFNPETANLYKRGDTILFKWCALDKEHYEFWESFQFSNNQGPFSSYIRAKDNINGGIGIWGAYNCQVELLIIPKK